MLIFSYSFGISYCELTLLFSTLEAACDVQGPARMGLSIQEQGPKYESCPSSC